MENSDPINKFERHVYRPQMKFSAKEVFLHGTEGTTEF